ncbi:MAG: DUF2029 domain-containing protein [Candidatus Hydrogenedentes bacterium]|nr:DUF2029 domain-containing protein [Candidatus Hydrogenedentota bacterium]
MSAVWQLKRPFFGDPRWWAGMLAAGLLMRLAMMPSAPMMNDDFYRYLWDGALVAHGHSPYAYAPQEIVAGSATKKIGDLGDANAEVIERINHPWLRTIYPPIAQAAFGMAHIIAPGRILGLRLVWLCADALTLVLLASLLKSLGLPRHFLLIYWWNPLLIKEVYNSTHMEALILPFVAGALLLAVRNRNRASAVLLALGVGAKLWPVLLLPALIRRSNLSYRQGMAVGATFVAVSCAVTAPLLTRALDSSSGLRAYASHWEMNDSLYTLLHAAGAMLTPENPHTAARAIVGILLAGWIAWLCRTPAETGRQLCARALWSVAALFLLSPTQFPWYWIWLLPLLVVSPSPALLLLTATLPLYYLRFPMHELGYVSWFDFGLVWIQFGPSLVLLAWEAWRRFAIDAAPHTKALAIHEI